MGKRTIVVTAVSYGDRRVVDVAHQLRAVIQQTEHMCQVSRQESARVDTKQRTSDR